MDGPKTEQELELWTQMVAAAMHRCEPHQATKEATRVVESWRRYRNALDVRASEALRASIRRALNAAAWKIDFLNRHVRGAVVNGVEYSDCVIAQQGHAFDVKPGDSPGEVIMFFKWSPWPADMGDAPPGWGK